MIIMMMIGAAIAEAMRVIAPKRIAHLAVMIAHLAVTIAHPMMKITQPAMQIANLTMKAAAVVKATKTALIIRNNRKVRRIELYK